jgi:ferredoxin
VTGVRVFIDPEQCQGHLRCTALLPDVFPIDDQGHAFTSPTGDPVPPEMEDEVRQAVGNCPERAITVQR